MSLERGTFGSNVCLIWFYVYMAFPQRGIVEKTKRFRYKYLVQSLFFFAGLMKQTFQ